jgi:hypothetical protein
MYNDSFVDREVNPTVNDDTGRLRNNLTPRYGIIRNGYPYFLSVDRNSPCNGFGIRNFRITYCRSNRKPIFTHRSTNSAREDLKVGIRVQVLNTLIAESTMGDIALNKVPKGPEFNRFARFRCIMATEQECPIIVITHG